jgi:hypothetical protein
VVLSKSDSVQLGLSGSIFQAASEWAGQYCRVQLSMWSTVTLVTRVSASPDGIVGVKARASGCDAFMSDGLLNCSRNLRAGVLTEPACWDPRTPASLLWEPLTVEGQ